MLLNSNFVLSLEEKCNHLECCECGKKHLVNLEWMGEVIVPHFPEKNTCFGFKEQVSNLINTEIHRRATDPFPLLR